MSKLPRTIQLVSQRFRDLPYVSQALHLMPQSSSIRRNRKRFPSHEVKLVSAMPKSEHLAHFATIASSLVAIVAILVSAYQFRENLRVQEDAVYLQGKTLHVERSSKAAELFEKFLENRSRTTDLPKGSKRDAFYLERENRGLMLLDAIYSSARGDDQWETLVQYSLLRYDTFVRDGKVLCLTLTDDFQALMDRFFPYPKANKCIDVREAQ